MFPAFHGVFQFYLESNLPRSGTGNYKKSLRNREEKSLRHVAMVAKFLGLNKATAIIALASFFAVEAKSINRGKNHHNPFYTF